ncbi:hypothetical protein HanIR_Chr09g0422441 [Helianthus annuus]|uniref:Uncharacterized protein n=1 Tax=Helianthus annuus TaxID=4232 RepID=A0A251TWT1_HELAN|nr:hypothetical protein HanIR_Chr09g0422441 [Helianthus annuus]
MQFQRNQDGNLVIFISFEDFYHLVISKPKESCQDELKHIRLMGLRRGRGTSMSLEDLRLFGSSIQSKEWLKIEPGCGYYGGMIT